MDDYFTRLTRCENSFFLSLATTLSLAELNSHARTAVHTDLEGGDTKIRG